MDGFNRRQNTTEERVIELIGHKILFTLLPGKTNYMKKSEKETQGIEWEDLT